MSKTLNMRFVLTNGRTSTMGVPNPKDDLAREDVEPVMQSIIEKSALLIKEATPESIKAAVIREVNETKLI
ncbi:MAG: DUF2922 domain-containing protein [Schwartzia sp.]|nr:DUF2922 domain-containing protein [Schwartzia sp. (in: firmicutes)]